MRVRTVHLASATAALCALVIAGCNSSGSGSDSAEDFQGDQRAVAQAVEDFSEAAEDRDGDKVCQQITQRFRERIVQAEPRDPCPEKLDDLLGDADQFNLDVEKVTIAGTTATVEVTEGSGGDERTSRIVMAREGRTWRLDSLGG